jgi:hypothetical protein
MPTVAGAKQRDSIGDIAIDRCGAKLNLCCDLFRGASVVYEPQALDLPRGQPPHLGRKVSVVCDPHQSRVSIMAEKRHVRFAIT